MIYLDTCALLKLAHREADSDALRAWLAAQPESVELVSSVLTEIEAARALRPSDPAALDGLPDFLAGFDLFEIDQPIRDRASSYADPQLRSLDAVHLATADELRSVLSAFVSYDKRLVAAALAVGLPVVVPG